MYPPRVIVIEKRGKPIVSKSCSHELRNFQRNEDWRLHTVDCTPYAFLLRSASIQAERDEAGTVREKRG